MAKLPVDGGNKFDGSVLDKKAEILAGIEAYVRNPPFYPVLTNPFQITDPQQVAPHVRAAIVGIVQTALGEIRSQQQYPGRVAALNDRADIAFRDVRLCVKNANLTIPKRHRNELLAVVNAGEGLKTLSSQDSAGAGQARNNLDGGIPFAGGAIGQKAENLQHIADYVSQRLQLAPGSVGLQQIKARFETLYTMAIDSFRVTGDTPETRRDIEMNMDQALRDIAMIAHGPHIAEADANVIREYLSVAVHSTRSGDRMHADSASTGKAKQSEKGYWYDKMTRNEQAASTAIPSKASRVAIR